MINQKYEYSKWFFAFFCSNRCWLSFLFFLNKSIQWIYISLQICSWLFLSQMIQKTSNGFCFNPINKSHHDIRKCFEVLYMYLKKYIFDLTLWSWSHGMQVEDVSRNGDVSVSGDGWQISFPFSSPFRETSSTWYVIHLAPEHKLIISAITFHEQWNQNDTLMLCSESISQYTKIF